MSSCAQSYGSFEDGKEIDGAFYEPPAVNTRFSYADAVTQSTAASTASLTGQALQFKATENELRDIIATLQHEVQELKGAQTPSTVTAENSTMATDAAHLAARMDTFESNVTSMMNQMSEMLSGASRHSSGDNASRPTHQDNRTDNRHRDKRTDNRLTPERPNHTNTTIQPEIEPRELWMDNGDGSTFSVGYAALPGQLGYPRSQLLVPGQVPMHGHPYHHPHQHQQELANQRLHQSLLRQQRQQENQQPHHNYRPGHPMNQSNAQAAVLTSPPRLLAEGALHFDV
jgi:hypothetical protein